MKVYIVIGGEYEDNTISVWATPESALAAANAYTAEHGTRTRVEEYEVYS